MTLKIATANSHIAVKWKNREVLWEDFVEQLRTPVRTSETWQEYAKMTKQQKSAAKSVAGGFVGGHLWEGRRKSGHVLCRTLLSLDADYATPDFIGQLNALNNWCAVVHSTHSHTADDPKLRLLIPLSREVSEDEYTPLARMVAREIGLDMFDDSTYEAQRLMYYPTAPINGEYVFHVMDGAPLDPDEYLSKYADWRDATQWPVSSRQSATFARSVRYAEDPLTKKGIVGAFCRAYSIEDAINVFLSDMYTPAAVPGRYDYIPADSIAGVVLYDSKFSYSHHATDPAANQLCNAFDLVRIHLFGAEDDNAKPDARLTALPSYKKMAELALHDDRVKLQIAEERRQQSLEDFTPAEGVDWQTKLEYMPRSKELANSVQNLALILNNDPDFANFAFNELAQRVQVTGEVPWDRPPNNRFWRDADTAQLKALLDSRYLAFSSRNHDVAFAKVADDRRFHPLRDYLDSLPPWDGVGRIETLLIRCLQADDTPYIRAVTRKTFAAAVARIYCPGTKFDCILVLDGAQGIGKSTLFKDLVGDEFYSETLSLTDMEDETGAEKLQGFWMVEIGELAGMKKADIEKVKAFLSTSDDKYRPSYGRTVESHPRQCIIIGSVNGERGYLRDITGNRRFWIVKVHQEEQIKRWDFTPEERDQIWAEAKHLWKNGEKLYLEGSILAAAEAAQHAAMEVDERQGPVEEYLDTLLPENWANMDLWQRRDYLGNRDALAGPSGVLSRTEVTNAEIWCECFGNAIASLKPSDSYSIAALMSKVDGWERTKTLRWVPLYGRQRIYQRSGVDGPSLSYEPQAYGERKVVPTEIL